MEETSGRVALKTADPSANAMYSNSPALRQAGPGAADGLQGFGPVNSAVGLDGTLVGAHP